jgi:hypothetical protein
VNGVYFKPWLGENYGKTKTLILGESAYGWRDKNGRIWHPSPSAPKKSLFYWLKHLEKRNYFSSMSKVLCKTDHPTTEQAKREWNEYAYAIYVQGTVGEGARKRPSSLQWECAAHLLLRLIENLRPLKIIVTGLDMWNHHMPGCNGPHLRDDLQAYKLSDGTLVWCLALPHPANTRQGFKWEKIGESIRQFESAKLPLREN